MQRRHQLGLVLSRTRGFSPRIVKQLYQAFGSAERLFCASDAELAVQELSPALIRRLRRAEHADDAKRALDLTAEWLQQSGDHHLLCLDDPEYPAILNEIDDPPVCLFLRGDPELLLFPQLAIVGSRRVTPRAAADARQLAQALSEAGLVPTSGLALGVDACAHQGALAGRGLTVAVLGSGVDQISPRCHQALAQQIVGRGGVILSEFSLGTPPLPAHFPRRNRIISGLSLGVLVVEAALRSGSLITARLAAEQGREVFALPGSIHNPGSAGTHQLIRQGAALVTRPEHILQELAPLLSGFANAVVQQPPANTGPEQAAGALEGDGSKVLAATDYQPTSLDLLVERCGLPASVVQSELLALELEGRVMAVSGGFQRL
ncbi:DNA-processing protein DprA [Motiliproteus sediminis]|uniref:DNA-processing protein DprA n=1 Tax=Motiliproteus sediminis TaxID=1468178 RepID=UPI001AEF8156|nr:DNA-processing protein DprA [Motiliproteus sediminis]